MTIIQEFVNYMFCPICKKSLFIEREGVLYFYSFSSIVEIHQNKIYYSDNDALYDFDMGTTTVSAECQYNPYHHSFERHVNIIISCDNELIGLRPIYSSIFFDDDNILVESFYPSNLSRINSSIDIPLISFDDISPDKLKKYMIFS